MEANMQQTVLLSIIKSQSVVKSANNSNKSTIESKSTAATCYYSLCHRVAGKSTATNQK